MNSKFTFVTFFMLCGCNLTQPNNATVLFETSNYPSVPNSQVNNACTYADLTDLLQFKNPVKTGPFKLDTKKIKIESFLGEQGDAPEITIYRVQPSQFVDCEKKEKNPTPIFVFSGERFGVTTNKFEYNIDKDKPIPAIKMVNILEFQKGDRLVVTFLRNRGTTTYYDIKMNVEFAVN